MWVGWTGGERCLAWLLLAPLRVKHNSRGQTGLCLASLVSFFLQQGSEEGLALSHTCCFGSLAISQIFALTELLSGLKEKHLARSNPVG